MVFEDRSEHTSQWVAGESSAGKSGCTAQALCHWARQVERDDGPWPNTTSDVASWHAGAVASVHHEPSFASCCPWHRAHLAGACGQSFAPFPLIRHASAMIEFGHGTHSGLHRIRNEDTYYADAALGLFLVADGMGGHLHGEVASALVRDAVVELVSRGHSLVEAIHGADRALRSHTRDATDPRPMGSTVAALWLHDQGFDAAWVGGSRIYAVAREFAPLEHDRKLTRALVDTGQLDARHMARHAASGGLTQALGVTAPEALQVGMAHGVVQADIGFLLCTDGLSEELATDAIAHVAMRKDLAAQECIDQLLLDALASGGRDNLTAVLVRAS